MRALLIAISLLYAIAVEAQDNNRSAIEGYWLNDSKSYIVQIESEEGVFNGSIVWLAEPFDTQGEPVRDIMNEEPRLRSRLVMGINTLIGFKYENDSWGSGKIYDLKSGQKYNGRLKLSGSDQLKVTGYYGILFFLGKTKLWTRVNDLSTYNIK